MDHAFILVLTVGSAAGGALLAALITWLICARKITAWTKRTLEAEATLNAVQDTDQRMRDAFASLSNTALRDNMDHFLTLAQERLERQQQAAQNDLSALVTPLKITLDEQKNTLQSIEQARIASYTELTTLVTTLKADQVRLQSETANLVKALRQPQVRGRWGEIQLRRVVELAGMSKYCDFMEQQTTQSDAGKHLRPDMQVRLPNQRQIVVDSKVPLMAYLDALEASDDDAREAHLKTHARQVRDHVNAMCKREYQKQIDGSHDFVVLFLPGEVFYSAALEHDRELLDYAAAKDVIMATPTTLIALLKAVAQGWREARLAEDARKVKETGEQIYKSLSTLAKHISEIGKGLSKATDAYNGTIGSMETHLLTQARRLHDLEISSDSIAPLAELTEPLRVFVKPELTPSDRNGHDANWRSSEES